ncbi:MAG: T9SS type A sorting domain-containing protein [Bacteroidales bacterium]|nr:T9SS type A sorting domain-containing protein [Bacteroidales bacterium]
MRKQTLFSFAITILLVLGASFMVKAQEMLVKRDTVSMEPGRIYDAYYSLKTGEYTQVIRDNWDIGFSTRIMDVTIRTNGANGIKLFTYPNSDISGWETLDTTGLSTWPEMYNDDTNWENGAFNINTSGSQLDFGWGVYNMTTHHIVGDSLFVLLMPDGKVKKLWIVEKNPTINEYTFKYADLDGSGETEKVIALNEYAHKNFIGFSFTSNDFVDREPASADWDLVFTKYMTFYMGVMWYPVTGVLQNYKVEVAAYPETDTSFMDYTIQALDSFNISTIGNNWYSLQGGMPPTYAITDSLVYFVSDKESSIWKLVFEYYESNLGDIGFKKQLIEDHTNISELQNSQAGNLAIHPNPASSNAVNLMFDAYDSGEANLNIFNLAGLKMIEKKVAYQSGLNNQKLDISNLPPGAYIVMMKSGNVVLNNKLIIQ